MITHDMVMTTDRTPHADEGKFPVSGPCATTNVRNAQAQLCNNAVSAGTSHMSSQVQHKDGFVFMHNISDPCECPCVCVIVQMCVRVQAICLWVSVTQ